jgi:Mg-chelatase subunit ChlD
MLRRFVLGTLLSASVAQAAGVNLVVVVDRQMSAEKMVLVKQALKVLLATLGSTDRLGVIAVGDDLLSQSGSDEVPRGRAMLEGWIDRLEAGKGTMEIGLGPPLEMAEGLLALTKGGDRSPRIVLVSDGAHVAGFVSNKELRARVTALAKKGVRVDALSPEKPVLRPPLEALAELGGGRLLVIHLAAEAQGLLSVAPRPGSSE